MDIHRKQFILIASLMLLSVAALSSWYAMPIYPDEIAIRLLSGRYIQDHGLAQRLFYICSFNSRETPILFIIPAWIFSLMDMHFSFVQMRIIPFITIIGILFLVVIYAAKSPNILAALISTTALIGVAGSGLVIARAEFLQVLNVAVCVWVFSSLKLTNIRPRTRYSMLLLLLFSAVFSTYVHIQGLIFLPITLYLAYLIASPCIGKVKLVILLFGLSFYLVKTTMAFTGSYCIEYPGIKHEINSMVFNLKEFHSVGFMDWLGTHFQKYIQSFYYKSNYQVNYLPAVTVNDGWLKLFLDGLNASIYFILTTNLVLFVFSALIALVFLIKQYITNYKSFLIDGCIKKGLIEAHVIVLFAFPLIFLFFYDVSQNFYRVFFINLLVSIMLTMLLSELHIGRLRKLAIGYFLICGAVVVVSLVVNVGWFSYRLHDKFEGPSISIYTDWNMVNADVAVIAKESNMDLAKGKIVVDDMTYGSLKNYSFLYPVTYLDYSGQLSDLSGKEIINIVRPNYAILRCDYLTKWNMVPDKSRHQLCAVNFLLSGYPK